MEKKYKLDPDKVIEWLKTEEGQKAIQSVIDKGTPFADKLEQARRLCSPAFSFVTMTHDSIEELGNKIASLEERIEHLEQTAAVGTILGPPPTP